MEHFAMHKPSKIHPSLLPKISDKLRCGNMDSAVYYYHGDHLGSASWITNGNGTPVQHLQYMPYGEPFVNERTTGYEERFTFMGKDLHTIADFYAHSNYIGLYMEYVGNNPGKELDAIPTFSDVLTNDKYSDFKQILEKNLKTGIYNSLIEDRNSTDLDSHHLMNYDCPESYMGNRDYNGLKGYDIAYSLAEREVNNAIQKQIKKE